MSLNYANDKKYKKTKRPDGSTRLTMIFDLVAMPSRTKTSMQKECDIRNILKTYRKTGTPLPSLDPSQFKDVSNLPSYHEALNVVRNAQEAFAAQPSYIRDRFKNDPALFLAFCQDAANAEEMVELGLAVKRPVAVPPNEPDKAPKASKKPKTPPVTDGGGQPEGGSSDQ